jgi:hypothetical protein
VSISERSPSVSSGRVTRTETLWGFIQSEEQQSTSKNADCDIDHLAECSLSATIGEIGLLHRYDEIMPLGIWMCLSPIIQNYQNGHSGGETHGFGIEHFKKGPYMSVHIYIYISCLSVVHGSVHAQLVQGVRAGPRGDFVLSNAQVHIAGIRPGSTTPGRPTRSTLHIALGQQGAGQGRAQPVPGDLPSDPLQTENIQAKRDFPEGTQIT